MPPKVNPLGVLKKGFKALKDSISVRQTTLQARIANKEPLSEADEHWMDNGGNIVDEQRVIDILDDASDYERAKNSLNAEQKELVEKLMKLGGVEEAEDGGDGTGKEESSGGNKHKRKRRHFDAVMAARKGDDIDIEEPDVRAQPVPTRQEALQAVDVLQRFLVIRGDDFSRQFEALLSSFGPNTYLEAIQSTTPTEITDYFAKK
ncbi:hypothetical protein L218DRAFT_1006987 [Marasmius fiardii PR-910]|nr:hypothetical protein L218DRAFT_1006987 [Marasmius fiardii PR-910]